MPHYMPCKWLYLPGVKDSHFAIASCDGSIKYLSEISAHSPRPGVADFYNGCRCPSCDHPIQIDYSLLNKGHSS